MQIHIFTNIAEKYRTSMDKYFFIDIITSIIVWIYSYVFAYVSRFSHKCIKSCILVKNWMVTHFGQIWVKSKIWFYSVSKLFQYARVAEIAIKRRFNVKHKKHIKCSKPVEQRSLKTSLSRHALNVF